MLKSEFYNFDCTLLNSLDPNMPSSKPKVENLLQVTESKDGHHKHEVEKEGKAGKCYKKVSCSF